MQRTGCTFLFTDDSQIDISNPDSFSECQTQISNFLHNISTWTDLIGISIFVSPKPDFYRSLRKVLLLKPFPSQSMTTILSNTQLKNLEAILDASLSRSCSKACQCFLWRFLPKSDYYLLSYHPSLLEVTIIPHFNCCNNLMFSSDKCW